MRKHFKVTKRIISIILVLVVAVGMIPMFAREAEALTESDVRHAGKNRYATAFKVAEALNKEVGKFDNIVVACGSNFPDALSGGYLTHVKRAPMLLVDQSQETQVTEYIKKYMLKGGTVYLLGGAGVIRSQYETRLKANGFKVKRLSGSSRYQTNLKILKETVKRGDELLVASGTGYADSLSGSAVPKGMLLVDKELSKEQKDWLKSAGITKFYILGGTGAVSKTVESQLKEYAAVERIGGRTRYETSYNIAKRFFDKAHTITMVTGTKYPDGLSGAPLAMKRNSPIILVDEGKYESAHEYVKEKGVSESITIGGTGAVSDNTVEKVMKDAKPKGLFTFLGYYTDPNNKMIFGDEDTVIDNPLYGMLLRNDTDKPIYEINAPMDLLRSNKKVEHGSCHVDSYIVVQPGQCFLSYTTLDESEAWAKYVRGNGMVEYIDYDGTMLRIVDSEKEYLEKIKQSSISGNLSTVSVGEKISLPKTTKAKTSYVESAIKLNSNPNMVTITDMKAYWNKPGFDNKQGVSTAWFRIKMKVGSKPIPLNLSEDGGRYNDGCVAFMDENGAILGTIEFLVYEDSGVKQLSAGKEIEIDGYAHDIPAGVKYYTIFWPGVINTVPKASKLGFNVKRG